MSYESPVSLAKPEVGRSSYRRHERPELIAAPSIDTIEMV